MGALCCCNNNKSDLDEYDEHRPILDSNSRIGINDGCDPGDYGSLTGVNGYVGTLTNGRHGGPNGPHNSYENSQTQLYNRVFNQLNQKSIDISGIEKTGELVDLNERETAINRILSSVEATVDGSNDDGLIEIRLDPKHQMSNEPIPMEDFQLITTLANQVSAAIEYDFVIKDAQKFVIKFEN